MKPLRHLLDRMRPAFEDDGKLHALYPLYEAIETFLYSNDHATPGAPHVRDSLDLKRLMVIVVVALLPAVWMAMWNTGYQANLALEATGLDAPPGWRGASESRTWILAQCTGRSHCWRFAMGWRHPWKKNLLAV